MDTPDGIVWRLNTPVSDDGTNVNIDARRRGFLGMYGTGMV